jgi:NAD(P)-dependent dehydrogenase (short-subunit alcohol dehydrogenase family)
MDPLLQVGVALITGAGSGKYGHFASTYTLIGFSPGIGQAIAAKFTERGCKKLFLVDINRNGLEDTQRLVKEASGNAEVHLHVTNVTIAAEVELMVKTCVAVFGRIDFAMNNAGIAQGGKKTADTPIEMFDRLANVNVKGVRPLHAL